MMNIFGMLFGESPLIETPMGCGHGNIVELTKHTRRCGTCGRCEIFNYSGFFHYYYYAVNKKDYDERRRQDLHYARLEMDRERSMVESWREK